MKKLGEKPTIPLGVNFSLVPFLVPCHFPGSQETKEEKREKKRDKNENISKKIPRWANNTRKVKQSKKKMPGRGGKQSFLVNSTSPSY
ncbi:hypothetical protein CEXT_433041 [Caerostris extrusa]|uniref:Uncharacterized protein n=1 Tax=Caerostris extrusa TaxID=172846 RepID=A0AAV4SHM5_CAEEX|nr:hypothetical protein CEXT_433041 [Caerostris extrusa]